jgi:hypothetical protein
MFNSPGGQAPGSDAPNTDAPSTEPLKTQNSVEQQESLSDPELSKTRFNFSKPSSIAQKYLQQRGNRR